MQDDEELNIKFIDLPKVWLSILTYWNLEDTKKMSKNAKEARKQLKCYSRTGALSYDVRREVYFYFCFHVVFICITSQVNWCPDFILF